MLTTLRQSTKQSTTSGIASNWQTVLSCDEFVSLGAMTTGTMTTGTLSTDAVATAAVQPDYRSCWGNLRFADADTVNAEHFIVAGNNSGKASFWAYAPKFAKTTHFQRWKVSI